MVNCLLGVSAVESHEVGGEDFWRLCLSVAVGFSWNMNWIAQTASRCEAEMLAVPVSGRISQRHPTHVQ